MEALPPTPKPRTRFGCGRSSAQSDNNHVDEPITSNGVLVATSSQMVSIYPTLDYTVPAPPKPPRDAAELPPRPPPPGWQLPAPSRAAPPPPSAVRSLAHLSPPIREAPTPPTAPCVSEKALPVVPPRPLNLNHVVPFTSKPAMNGGVSPTLIENSVYMTLEKFRELTVSASHESGFISHNSPSHNNGSCSVSDMDELPSDDDSVVPCSRNTTVIQSASTVIPPRNLLDLKPLPPPPDSSIKSFNDYTPPPKRDDYVFASEFRESVIDAPIGEDKQDGITLNTDTTDTEIEAEGVAVSYFGFVSIHAGKKERKRAYARLKNMLLSFHEDDECEDYLCGPYQLTGCQMISRSEETISLRLNELETQKHVTFCVEGNKEEWSLLLSECWLSQYESLRSSVAGMTTCGTFFMRQGTASQWQRAAAGLQDRTLHYVLLDSPDCIYELDIRKVISIREKVEKDQWCPLVKKKSHRGSFMLVLEGCTLYVECEDEWSTNLWYEVVEAVLTRPAHALDEYRLTGDNVPIVVDKCIRFISAYGMASEGIYRRNGKISEAKDILSRLNKDAPGVHLKPANDETVYAVADVLRQFFRKLSTPLIPHEIQATLFNIVSTQGDVGGKCMEMGSALQTLPLVNYNTLRKLISHLKDVTTNSGENRASVENLAKVFGASLFHTDSEAGPCFSENSNQISVIAMLIRYYDRVFELTLREELSREMIEQATKLNHTPQHKVVRADGLLVAVHIWEKENMPFNAKTDLAAEEVCRDAIAKRGFDGEPGGKYALYEYIRDGVLSRRLEDCERLSDSVINRWIPWKCVDGYLLFSRDSANFDDIENMSTYSGKVKVAEPGSKTFRSMEMKVDEGQKVAAYKGDKRAREWSLDTTVWYMGAEPSRKAPYPYSATFFTEENNNFMEKFVGFCVSFKSSVERTKFLNQIYYLQHSGRPTPLVHI